MTPPGRRGSALVATSVGPIQGRDIADPPAPFARFDDLGPGGASIALAHPGDVLVAHSAAEVAPTLRAAEQAARDGAWVAGFVTYEAAAGLNPQLPVTAWPAGHPLAALPLAWFATFGERRDVPQPSAPTPSQTADWAFDRDEQWHRTAVDVVRAAIAAGDYYQLNLTLRTCATIEDPQQLHAELAHAQRGSFHALLRTGEHTVVSASPELFFTRRSDLVTTRPMKGTARRGADPVCDLRLATELRASAKERAENIMIVDLLRNDLSRIAVPGGIDVPRLLEVEAYPTVWQLTSTINARTPPGVDLVDLFTALFPSGSVTGAPKQAAMAAIAELEGRPRGVYCGAVGFLRPTGRIPDARFSVAIRTVTSASDGYAEYGVGGGITYSSEASAEWREVDAKTRVLDSATRHSVRPMSRRAVVSTKVVCGGPMTGASRCRAAIA